MHVTYDEILPIVQDVYNAVFADSRLKHFFDPKTHAVDLPRRMAKHLVKYINGNCLAEEVLRIVRQHAGMEIKSHHIDRLMTHVIAAAIHHNVPEELASRITHHFRFMGNMIAEKDARPDEPDHISTPVRDRMRRAAEHELFQNITDKKSLQIFMESHVFAVWDFMCLLKHLQNILTCMSTWWSPRWKAESRRFINEICMGEESDQLPDGRILSHYEMYLDAMKEVGARWEQCSSFVKSKPNNTAVVLKSFQVPLAARQFVATTFGFIEASDPREAAAAFTLGREQAIPAMFSEMLKSSTLKHLNCPKFIEYLERHIEVDGDQHGPMAMQLLESLCSSDKDWGEVNAAACEALDARILMWDLILDQIRQERNRG